MSGVAGVLLAAGLSSRMGAPKALLDWQGQPLVVAQTRALRAGGCAPVVVVVGHEAAGLCAALAAEDVVIVENSDYRAGRAGSVRTGAWAVANDSEALLLLNVDQPRPASVVHALIAAWRAADALIVSPTFEGHGGHPSLFAGSLLDELRQVEDATQGLRAVVVRHAAARLLLPWPSAEVLLDLNDRAAYESARSGWASPPGTR
jgi:molybdenum cofactor cytidylyltransferase